MLEKKERIKWIDFIKGFTIFLVVFGHVNTGILMSERFLDHQILLETIYHLMVNIRMPLFFMVSGFLYYTKLNSNIKDLERSILNKLISLGIPYFIFSVFVWILKFVMTDDVQVPIDWLDLLLLPIQPIGHFWFLYALFLIFVLTEILDYIFKNNYIVFCIVMAISIIGWQYERTDIDVSLLDHVQDMIAFFYIGKMLRKNLDIFKNNRFVILSVASYLVLQSLCIYFENTYKGLDFVISVSVVFAIIGIVTRLKGDSCLYKYFSSIGIITMPIYLLHPTIISATRIILFKLGVTDIFAHFALGIIMGWFVSIFVYKIARKSKYTDFLFYPGRYLKA